MSAGVISHSVTTSGMLRVPYPVLFRQSAFTGPLHLPGINGYIRITMLEYETKGRIFTAEVEETAFGTGYGQREVAVTDHTDPLCVVPSGSDTDRRSINHATPAA